MLAPFEQYLVDCIEHEGTTTEKLSWMIQQFDAEFSCRAKQVGREQAMSEWLQSLCPSVCLAWENHSIGELHKRWGIQVPMYQWIYGWFALCAKTLLDLHQRHCIATTWYKQCVNMAGAPIGVDSVREWIKNNPEVSERLRHTYFGWVGTEYKVIVSVQSYGKTDYMPDEDYINGVTYNITQHN